MATPISGRYASVRIQGAVSSSDDPGIIVDNLGHWEVAINFDELDASVFGTVWKKNMTGMQGWSGSIEGFFDPSTTTSKQIEGLMNAALDATLIQDFRFYLETSSGLFLMPHYSTCAGSTNYSTDAGAYISNVRVAHDKSGLASASYSVLGYGPLALFSGASSGTVPTPMIIEGT